MNIDENEISNIDNEFDYDDEDNELKLQNLRENFGSFWEDLDDNEKAKYIKLVCERYN